MPPPATPSPFRLSRRYPPSRRSGPQFAHSPRFLLSQSAPRRGDLDIVDDDTVPPSSAPATAVPAEFVPSAIQSRRHREAIQDSDDDEWLDNLESRGGRNTGLANDQIESSPPQPSHIQSPGYQDLDDDARFAPSRDGNKRMRLFAPDISPIEGTSDTSYGVRSPSPDTRPSIPPVLQTPGPRILPRPAATQEGSQLGATPNTHARPRPLLVETPESTQTPLRSRPRFLIGSQQPRSTQSALWAESPSATQSTSLGRHKPAFVLPRSPSPKAADDDLPAPFSPSSKSLHRRGKNRPGATGYVPGGMAAELRSWVLETGTRHDQARPGRRVEMSSDGSVEISRYLVAARVLEVKPAIIRGSGALSFIRATNLAGSSTSEAEPAKNNLNIVLMGAPRAKSRPGESSPRMNQLSEETPRPGDLVGVQKGLSWYITLGEDQAQCAPSNVPDSMALDHMSPLGEEWLITMQWELIERAV
ncbi:hypothetical protein N7539_009272 [Penicillium diatomitis]|uniref:Uncharacterized protein n=1 Tax=Penicillium diatomitis TaxID=2819901 RepID=A0A9W9WLD3_9EURO|nr:uncharacterized protein N7539_009272 [Penicillium diatomitis]KAJ5469654.1 hypothetical protein N7539_009272 [Penicillium diatomitis]